MMLQVAVIKEDALKINLEELVEDIEFYVEEHYMGYFEAIVYYCEKKGYDIEAIASIIPNSLKSKMETEAKKMRLLKKKYNNEQVLPI